MKDFGTLKGADIIPLLSTLLQEGAFASENVVMALSCVRKSNGAKTILYFCSDYLIRSKSYQYSPVLADIFYARRLLERGQKEEIEAGQQRSRSFSVGQFVLDQGWVSQNEVAQVITQLIEIAAYEVLQWEQVQVHLSKAEGFAASETTSIPDRELLSVESFIADADKNLPVLKLIQQELQDFNWILKRLKEVQRGELSAQQAHIYRYINHQRTLFQLLQISDLDYFETLAAAYQLIKWGYIGRSSTPERRQQRVMPSVPKSPPKPAAKPAAKPAEEKSVTTAPAAPKAASRYKIARRRFLHRSRGSDFFQILHGLLEGGETRGQVIVESQTQPLRATFELDKTQLFHASSSAANVRFGDILIKQKRITHEALKEALKIQRAEKRHLGEVLVEQGVIGAADISRLIYHQMECVLYEVLTWNDAKFYFSSEPSTRSVQREVSVPVHFDIESGRLVQDEADSSSLLHEADRALPILLMIRERLPALDAVPVKAVSQPQLSDMQKEVWQWIDGYYSLQDILMASSLGYVDTFTALYQMYSTHSIGFEREQSPPQKILTQIPSQVSPASIPQASSGVTAPPPESSKSVRHPLEILLGDKLIEQLLELPDHQHKPLRQLLSAALEMGLT